MHNISIVIASRNTVDHLRKCLESIEKVYGNQKPEVIIADNDSSDGSVEMARENFTWAIVDESKETGCYASAVNRGARAASKEYILLLDSDAILLENTIPALVDFLSNNPKVGAAASKMFYPDGTLQLTTRKFPTPLNMLFGRETLLTRLFPKNRITRSYLMLDELNESKPFKIDWSSSACIMLRREVFNKADYWDEDFLLYWADADFCHRVTDAGYEIYCVPESQLIHDMRNDQGRKKSYFMIKAFHQGIFRYYRKHCTKSKFHPMNAVAFIGLSLRAGIHLLINSFRTE